MHAIKVQNWTSLGALPGHTGRYRIFGEYEGGGFYADLESKWRGGDEWDVRVGDTNYVGARTDLEQVARDIVRLM